MAEKILGFYEPLAEHFHLIFDDWDKSIERQAGILNTLLAAQGCGHPLKILDCACGVGTQALGFASFGHRVVASDLSRAAVNRARREAESRGVNISFYVSDMTSLTEIADRDFDVVAALDNAISHLSTGQLVCAIKAAASKLKSNGLFIASTRDYDTLILQRPAMQPPAFYGTEGNRRIVHQVWDWIDEARYPVHLFITTQNRRGQLITSSYRALQRSEFSAVLQSTGFEDVRWLMPPESGFYQPLVLARWP
jgi:glycine/sarcosine N-methyltransferase